MTLEYDVDFDTPYDRPVDIDSLVAKLKKKGWLITNKRLKGRKGNQGLKFGLNKEGKKLHVYGVATYVPELDEGGTPRGLVKTIIDGIQTGRVKGKVQKRLLPELTGYKRVPGTAKRYKELSTGKTLSYRQYLKKKFWAAAGE